MRASTMDTQPIKDYIHQLQIEQLTALGEFREQWVRGHVEVTGQVGSLGERVSELKEQVLRQNGNVATIQKWQADHPIVCEVKAVITLLTKEIDSLKQQIYNRDVSDVQKEKDDQKWEMRLRPILKIIGILVIGAVGAKIPELGKLLKLW